MDVRVRGHVPVDLTDLGIGCPLFDQELDLETKCPRPGVLDFVTMLERCHGTEAAHFRAPLPRKMIRDGRDEASHTGPHHCGLKS